jgi:hypothetical protein
MLEKDSRIVIHFPEDVVISSSTADRIEQILYRTVVEKILPLIHSRFVDPTEITISVGLTTVDTTEDGRQIVFYKLRREP